MQSQYKEDSPMRVIAAMFVVLSFIEAHRMVEAGLWVGVLLPVAALCGLVAVLTMPRANA